MKSSLLIVKVLEYLEENYQTHFFVNRIHPEVSTRFFTDARSETRPRLRGLATITESEEITHLEILLSTRNACGPSVLFLGKRIEAM